MPLGNVVVDAGDPTSHAYFPTDCIVARLHVTAGGAATQVSMVGNEGFVGIAMFLGGDSMPHRAVVQSSGFAYRLEAQLFQAECQRHGETETLVLRYAQSLITQMAQTVVCNRHHTIMQQLCRWLLLSLDRLPGNQLTITQELIASILGVRRESVTVAASELHRLGAIDYSRGHIVVLDRVKLEQNSCECYFVVMRETERLLPYLPRNRNVLKSTSPRESRTPKAEYPSSVDPPRKQ